MISVISADIPGKQCCGFAGLADENVIEQGRTIYLS